MSKFLTDTSCIIPFLCDWHPHHLRTQQEIEHRLADGETMVVAAHALTEAYSVLSRLPRPLRLTPAEALAVLRANFMANDVETVALSASGYHRLLQSAAEQEVAGGRIYDAVIVACALAAGAQTLLTFNDRDFRALAPAELKIVVPQEREY